MTASVTAVSAAVIACGSDAPSFDIPIPDLPDAALDSAIGDGGAASQNAKDASGPSDAAAKADTGQADSGGGLDASADAADASSLPSVSIQDVSLTEGDADTKDAVFVVTLSAPSAQPVTVDYTTANGSASSADGDYASASGTLTFPAGTTAQNIVVKVNGDTTNEADESFGVNLANAVGASIADGAGTGTITNDDPVPSLSVNDVTVAEGNTGTTAVTFTVSLSAASGQLVTVKYATEDGTATAPSDYTAVANGTLSFAAGELSKTITVNVNGDTTTENDETFSVKLSTPSNATIADDRGHGTVLNDDSGLPTIAIDDVSLTEGNSGNKVFSFTATLSATSTEKVTVKYTTADDTAKAGSDYTAATNTVTFNPGETTAKIDVTVQGDTTYEADETFFVNLSDATNATIADAQGIGTIVNDDAPPSVTIDDVIKLEGGGGTSTAFTFTVTLSAASGLPATVTFETENDTATAGSDYVGTTGALLFQPGETSKKVTVTVNGDNTKESNEAFFVVLTGATGATIADDKGVGTILNDDF